MSIRDPSAPYGFRRDGQPKARPGRRATLKDNDPVYIHTQISRQERTDFSKICAKIGSDVSKALRAHIADIIARNKHLLSD